MNKQERGLKTRSKILKMALLCFARNGFDNTSIEQICNRAGMSKGAFYHHFESKQHLFLELVNDWLKRIDERLQSLGLESGDVKETISKISSVAESVFKEAGDNVPIFLEIWLKIARDPAVHDKLVEPYQKYLSYFKDLIQKSIDSSNLKKVNAEATARLVIALSLGLLLQSYFEKENQDWEGITREAFLVFTQGILAREG